LRTDPQSFVRDKNNARLHTQSKEIEMKSKLAVLSAAMAIGCIGTLPCQAEGNAYIMYRPGDMKWADNTSLPKGAKIAILMGDPKTGPYIYRIKFPPHYVVPAHTHPDDRTVTVISGTLYHGEGNKFDAAKLHDAPAGSIFGEGRAPHFGETRDEEAVFQVAGPGPTGITYIDPADDPRNK
jgi:hypothetical protein